MGKNFRSVSGMNIPDHISESLETFFELKTLKFFGADPGSGIFLTLDPGWKNLDRILDKHPGSAALTLGSHQTHLDRDRHKSGAWIRYPRLSVIILRCTDLRALLPSGWSPSAPSHTVTEGPRSPATYPGKYSLPSVVDP